MFKILLSRPNSMFFINYSAFPSKNGTLCIAEDCSSALHFLTYVLTFSYICLKIWWPSNRIMFDLVDFRGFTMAFLCPASRKKVCNLKSSHSICLPALDNWNIKEYRCQEVYYVFSRHTFFSGICVTGNHVIGP